MKIIIPMTGYGSRFVSAGYGKLKPLIEVFGHPILEWIVKGMYSSDDEFIFVCRKEHLNSIVGMRDEITRIRPAGKIVEIDDWVKKGPVFDILRMADEIDDKEPYIVNYCDVYVLWNLDKFKQDLKIRDCDGSVPCYTGFHPNLLPKDNVYASCRVDEEDNLLEIREKYSFEADKLKARHSAGIYYFKSGLLLKKYFQKLVDANDSLKGEFYASLPYNYMVRDGLTVWVPTNIEFYCNWGTPQDMEDSVFWMQEILGGRK